MTRINSINTLLMLVLSLGLSVPMTGCQTVFGRPADDDAGNPEPPAPPADDDNDGEDSSGEGDEVEVEEAAPDHGVMFLALLAERATLAGDGEGSISEAVEALGRIRDSSRTSEEDKARLGGVLQDVQDGAPIEVVDCDGPTARYSDIWVPRVAERVSRLAELNELLSDIEGIADDLSDLDGGDELGDLDR